MNNVTGGRNKVIDGWRGISVILVIISHIALYRIGSPDIPEPLHELIAKPDRLLLSIAWKVATNLGYLGVSVFFLISGYLITSLLVSEETKNGKINILAFYVRRIFRIMPAFYLYVSVIYALSLLGYAYVRPNGFLLSSVYMCNLYYEQATNPCSWWLGHTWSLSVEEQFYLIWPLTFALLAHERTRTIALAVIFAALTAGLFWFEALRGFPCIAIGSLFGASQRARDLLARTATPLVILTAAALVVLQPLPFPKPVAIALQVMTPLLIALAVLGTLRLSADSFLARIIANRFFVLTGTVSYSLYLWQQVSLGPDLLDGQPTGADMLRGDHPLLVSLMFIPLAIASYRLVERPFVRIGHKLSQRIMPD